MLAMSMAISLFACDNGQQEETTQTEAPTETEKLTVAPTDEPTASETDEPTDTSSEQPTQAPTVTDTAAPTETQTAYPTEQQTQVPTTTPTEQPTEEPTAPPTQVPTQQPTETPTQQPTEVPTEVPTETPTEVPTETPTQQPTEVPTEFDPDSIVYEPGADIDSAGHKLEEDAFALTDRTFDRALAVEKTAEEIKAMLADKTSMTEGAVYIVKEPIVLDSNTKYYGNFAAIIAEGGLIIKDAEEILIKELVFEGNITVEKSTGITIFRLCMTSSGIAINVSEDSYDVAVKSCRVKADETALVMGADFSSIYQNYFCADNGVIATGDDMAAQSNVIVAKSLGISSTGAYCTVMNNTVEAASDGIAVSLAGSTNGLVALNKLAGAQMSVSITDSFNCSVILNSAIRLFGANCKNLYLIDNKLGGAVELENNNYLICDGNTFPKDELPHPVVSVKNENYNGDGMHDVDARLEVGADEDLLPHTNKDLFISMERRTKVRDLSLPKSYAFNGYVRNMAKNEDYVIVPPGVYSVSSTLNLQAAHANTTIYAYGVYQESTKYIKNLDISSANNLTVKGLTIGYSQQSAGQIQVLDKVDRRKMTLLVVPSAGFTQDFGKLNTEKFSTGGYFYHTGSYTSWTEIGIWGGYSVIPNEDGSLQNPDGTFTIQISGKDAAKYYNLIEEGEIFTCRLNEANDRTVQISGAKNILFKDTVTYGYADALCFVIGGANTEVEFYRHHNLAHSAAVIDEETYNKYVAFEEAYGVDLEVHVDGEGRFRGADPRIGSVDATHMASPSKGLSATSTLFENACDDAANQRGNSSALHNIIDNKDGTYTILYKDYIPETYLNMYLNQGKTEVHPGHQVSSFAAGDRIFIYTSGGKVVCDANVLTAATSYQTNAIVYEGDHKVNGETVHFTWRSTIFAVTVREGDVDLDALEGYDPEHTTPDMSNKIIVDNLSRNSVNFTFDNCMVRHNRGRFVVKTRDATITNCTFKDTTMAGVVLSVESTWGESSVPQNVTVTKCLFDGTSQTHNYDNNTKYAAIAVEGLGSGGVGMKVNVEADSIPCKNINITDNVFKNVPNNYYVTVSAAQGVTIKNNVFEARSTETAKRVGKAIYINGCMTVDISDNTYSEFANGDVTRVVVANNYKNLFGTDVEGIFEKDKLAETEAETDAVTE